MIKLELLPETTLQLQVAEKVIKTAPQVIVPKHITENGTYFPKAEGVNGFSPVTVEVDMSKAREEGRQEALDSLPAGYLKVDPTWTSWYMLCNGRPSIVQSLRYEDSANVTNFTGAFQDCRIKSIPRLDFRKAQNISSLCIYSTTIEEVGQMEIPNVTNTSYAFSGCTGLKRITFVPGCIKASIGFPNSHLLSQDSVESILQGLADLRGAQARTLTFHKDVGEKLTEEQKAAITAKNWILVY